MNLNEAVQKLWTVRTDGDDELSQARGMVIERAVTRDHIVREYQRLQELLAPLCPCGPASPDTQGPLQECPLHGDGTTFVTRQRWLEHLFDRAKEYCETPALSDEAAADPRVVDPLPALYERLEAAVVAVVEGEHPAVSAFMHQLGLDGE